METQAATCPRQPEDGAQPQDDFTRSAAKALSHARELQSERARRSRKLDVEEMSRLCEVGRIILDLQDGDVLEEPYRPKHQSGVVKPDRAPDSTLGILPDGSLVFCSAKSHPLEFAVGLLTVAAGLLVGAASVHLENAPSPWLFAALLLFVAGFMTYTHMATCPRFEVQYPSTVGEAEDLTEQALELIGPGYLRHIGKGTIDE